MSPHRSSFVLDAFFRREKWPNGVDFENIAMAIRPNREETVVGVDS